MGIRVNGRIVLKRILKNRMYRFGMDQTGTSKHDIEHSGTAEGGQLLGYVTLKFLKRFLLHVCL
jgi:hypothetical protein